MLARFGFIAAASVAAATLFAGGFWLQIGTAEANRLVVKATGCQDPSKAEVSGVVLRMIDGRRQTTPLTLVAMKERGTFAVVREWPADATVTLEFVGHNAGASTSMLVRARGDAIEKASAKFYPHEPTAEEEMASLAR